MLLLHYIHNWVVIRKMFLRVRFCWNISCCNVSLDKQQKSQKSQFQTLSQTFSLNNLSRFQSQVLRSALSSSLDAEEWDGALSASVCNWKIDQLKINFIFQFMWRGVNFGGIVHFYDKQNFRPLLSKVGGRALVC